jgi:FkbM family methyltransferase
MIAPRAITSIGGIPWLGRICRWYASQYSENSVVRIRHGHATGLLWRRHHRYVHGYWIGHYEFPLQEALRRELKPGHTFFDIGAHAGFFTLIAARLVGAGGRCVAFEPLPENCASIREQIEANSLHRCSVVNEAVSDFIGSASFAFAATGSSVAHLGEPRNGERQLAVKVTTVDDACARFGKPDFIKMDIEGAEARALKGALHTLRDIRPGWLIELHGPDCEREVKALLRNARYAFFDLQGLALDHDQELPRHFIARPIQTGEA